MKDLLDEACIIITKENRKQIDQAIHQTLGITYKNCSVTWKTFKDEIGNDSNKQREFIKQLHTAMH